MYCGRSLRLRMLVAAPLLILTAAAYCTSPTHASTPPDLRFLALRLSDLPGGSTIGSARYWSNAQAAARDHVSVSQYARHGRIRSYENTFDRTLVDGLPARGLVRANSQIVAYTTQQGAHWDFVRSRNALGHSGVLGATTGGTRVGQASHLFRYTPVALPPIGNEDAGYKAESAGDEFAYTTRTIVFRRGRYLAIIRLVGYQGQLPQRQAVSLARVVDRRLAAA